MLTLYVPKILSLNNAYVLIEGKKRALTRKHRLYKESLSHCLMGLRATLPDYYLQEAKDLIEQGRFGIAYRLYLLTMDRDADNMVKLLQDVLFKGLQQKMDNRLKGTKYRWDDCCKTMRGASVWIYEADEACKQKKMERIEIAWCRRP